jgi:phosphate-selective porin OprO/OprP
LGDFTDGSTTSTSQTRIDEGYLTYSGYKPVQVRAGKFKAPFSLEQLTSSNNIDFMERSLTGSDDKELIPGKQFGAMIFGSPMSGVSYALARHAGASGTESASRDASDTTGRLAANFAEVAGNKEWVTHVGIAYSVGKVGNTAAAVAPSTEGKGLSSFLVTNSTALAVNSTRTRIGYELAAANGPFKVQGEMYSFDYGDNQTVQQNITGSYVQAIWNITGESHNYSNSSNTFGWIKPKQNFSTEKGGLGAWQVGLRFSKIDTDIAATSTLTNAADATTLGLTWFANDYTRVMLNYVQTNFASNVKVASGQTKEEALNLRAQVSF